MPARAFRQTEVHQQRHDTEREAARQRYQAEALRIAGENEADKGQQRESARQHDLVYRAVGAAVLGRHQFGGDRERRRHGKSRAETGQQADDEQLRAGLRQRYQQGEERAGNNADLHHGLAAEAVGNRRGREGAEHEEENRRDREPTNLLGGQMQRLLG